MPSLATYLCNRFNSSFCMKRLFTLLSFCAFGTAARAQLVSGEAFLQGNYVEVGVNACGTYGSYNSAPTGYHANGGSATGGSTALGFVADYGKDGWTTGTPAMFGDYFLPGSPVAGWSLTVGSTTYSNDRGVGSATFCSPSGTASTMTGSVTSVTSSGTSMQATWVGTGSGIELRKYVTVKSTKAYFTTRVVLKNTTASPIYNTYYGEYVDPDNDVPQGGSFVSVNTVVSQVSSGASASLVKAVSSSSFAAYLGIGSKDCRSKVFRGTSSASLTPNTLNAGNWYNLTGSVDMSHSGAITQDNYTGIVFYVDTLLAGDSTGFTMAYILSEPDLAEALSETGPGFTALGGTFNDGDTVLLCPVAGTTYPLTVTGGDFSGWTWTPSAGLSTTTGPSTSVTISGSSPLVYYAIGTGPCGLDSVKITILPQGAILHVDSAVAVSGTGASWASPLKTVREALNLANAVTCIQEIWVKKGTYKPTTGTNRDSSFRIIRNGLKMYGGFGGFDTTMATRNPALYPTILSGDIGTANDSTDNVYHVMTVVGRPSVPVDSSVRIDGFTITRGNSVGASGTIIIAGQALPRLNGGGILLWGAGSGNTNHAIINNCRFVRNSAGLGGGLHAEASASGVSNPTISSCVFQQNRATSAGGGLNAFGSGGASSPIVTNTSFTDNKAENFGGGAYGNGTAPGSTATYTGCTFTGNTTVVSASVGGGMFNAGPNLNLSACNFLNNTAQNRGGGLASGNGTVTASRCAFAYNTAGGTGGSGGGFAQTSGASAASTFTNCAFANNNAAGSAADGGGGVYLIAGSGTFNNSTFSANTTASTAAAASSSNSVRYATGTTFTLNNTIVWGGAAGHIQGTGTASYNYSLVKGLALTAPNLTIDPIFANPADPDGTDNLWATSDDGLRLDSCSPAINAGSNLLVPTGVTTDLPLALRIQQVTVDMGAYESPYLPQPGPPVVSITASATVLPCPDTIDFVTTVTGGVAGTTYQWIVNSTPVGTPTTSTTFSSSTLANNDTVWVIVTNPPCNKKDSSNRIVVSISAGPGLSAGGSTAANPTACGLSNGTITLGTFIPGTTYTISYTYNGTPQTPASLTASATGTITLSSLPAGIYASIIASVGSCSSAAIGPYTLSSPATPATPTATATTPICAGGTVSLTTPTVTGATYSWTGPSGFSSTLQNPSIAAATTGATGTYSVTVTVAGCTSAPGSVAVTVNPNVTTGVTLAASPGTAICAGTSVTFTATPTGAGTTPTYTWTKNGVTLAGVTSTTYSSSTLASGDIIAVTLSSSAPCATPTTGSASLTMVVTPNPTTPGAITGTTPVCAGTAGTYSVTPVAGATGYTWTLPTSWTGTSTTASIATMAGTLGGTISVTASNICGTSLAATLPVVVDTVPGLPVLSGPVTACAGSAVTYSVPPVAGATAYTWTLPSGWTGSSATASITATTGTTGGTVSVTVTNACGTSPTASQTVSVGTTPAAPGTISGPAAPCVGVSTTYTVSPVGGATSYSWTLPAGWAGTSSTNSISVTPTSTGGTISVTVTASCGTSPASTLAVTPVATPLAPGTITGTAAPCVGTSQTYSVTPIAGATTYTWTMPTGWTGTSTTSSITTTVGTTAGTISVTAGNACGTSAAATLAVTPNNLPAAPASISGTAAPCAGTTQTYSVTPVAGAASYTWTLPIGWTGTSTTSSITTTVGTTSGSVSVVATNACGSSAAATLATTVNATPATPGAISGPASGCAGTAVTYSVTPVPGATSYTWTLPTGWVGTSTTASISTTVGTTGGTVAVTATNACGTSAAATLTISVGGAPAAPGAISGPAAPCPGAAATYSVAPVSGVTSYNWTLPSGWTGTSTTNTISLTAGTAGGTISVTVTNACGTSAATTLAVSPGTAPTTPGSISGPAAPCTGTPQTYSVAPVAGAATYSWTLPTGWAGTSTAASITATTGAAGGTVTVTATNACGTSAAATLPVSVSTAPAAPGAITGPTAPCAGTAQTYSVAPVTGATSYTWTLPVGWTGTSATSSIAATTAGSGTVSVTATNACGTSPATTLAVTASNVPPAPGAVSGPTGLCVGASGTYTAAPVAGATSYVWTLPAGWSGSSSTTSMTATAGSSGSGTIQVAAVNGCGTGATAALAVAANPTTPVSVSILSSPPAGSICAGSTLTLTAVPSGGGSAPGYQWTQNGVVMTATGATFTPTAYASGDMFGVQLTSSAACPAAPTATAAPLTIVVNPTVVPGINVNALIASAPVVCAGTPITFTSNIVGGGPLPSYQWTKNGVPIPGATDSIYSGSGWVDGDTIKCILTSNATCATPATMPSNGVGLDVAPNVPPGATISASPGTTFTPGTPVTFTATSITGGGAAPALQWLRNGSPVFGATDTTWTTSTLMNGDTVRLRVTSSDICASPGMALSNKLGMRTPNAAGIGTQAAGAGGATLELYPNPNAGHFTLTLPDAAPGERLTLQVFNALGQVVYLREVFPAAVPWSTEVKLGLSPAEGVYLLRVTGEDGGQAGVRFEVRY